MATIVLSVEHPRYSALLLSYSRSTNEFLLQQSTKLACIFSVHEYCLTSAASEVEELKAKLAKSRATVGELQGELKTCEERISRLDWERVDSRKKMKRLEREVKEASGCEARLAAEN